MKNNKQMICDLLYAIYLIKKGKNQKELREEFGETLGAKLYLFIELDARFPSLGLIDMILDQEFSFKKLRAMNVIEAAYRSNPELVKRRNQHLIETGFPPQKCLTMKEVAEKLFE